MGRMAKTWLAAALVALAAAPAAHAQMPGGDGTQDILGFINGGNSQVSGAINRVVGGEDLTDEQRDALGRIIARGPMMDAIGGIQDVLDQIDVDVRNSEDRLIHGYEQVDSNGQLWRYSADSGGWVRVDEDPLTHSPVYTPGPEIPDFQYGPSSGSIYATSPGF